MWDKGEEKSEKGKKMGKSSIQIFIKYMLSVQQEKDIDHMPILCLVEHYEAPLKDKGKDIEVNLVCKMVNSTMVLLA